MAARVHFYDNNHAHYLTKNVYRRARIFDSDRFKLKLIATLSDLREELGFRIFGYVVMPEHCHLLIWPGERADPSQIMRKLSERTANFVLRALRSDLSHPWCRGMRARFELPVTLHSPANYRVWQRGGYDMNLWTPKKILEKLSYMHNNPVRRGLVSEPGEWPWSSWRFLLSRGQLRPENGSDTVSAIMVGRARCPQHEKRCCGHPRGRSLLEMDRLD